MLRSILFYPVVPFDYSLQAGRSGVHSRVVPSTRHTLGPRDAVRRYLGLVSPVCCGCDVRVEPRSGPLGQDGIDYFFFYYRTLRCLLSGRARGMLASLLVVFVVFCCCDSPDGAVDVPSIQFQCTFHFYFFPWANGRLGVLRRTPSLLSWGSCT